MKNFFTLLFSFYLSASFGQMAVDKCKFLGNIYQPGISQTAFTAYWNQVTPENAGKWGSVESTRDVMNWANLKSAYNLADDNGFLFKQHTLVWGSQYPNWLVNIPDAERTEEIEEWIQLYGEEFPGPQMVDVVNEPIHASEYVSTALGGPGNTGWDWVIRAFELAREHIPEGTLIINDYNIINNASAVTQYMQIIQLLQERDLIDGIGLQAHYFSLGGTSNETLQSNLDKLAELDLPIYITELEIEEANDETQLSAMMRIFPVLWEHPAVHGVTMWGYREGAIWRPDGYLVRSDGTERPALKWLKNYIAGSTGGYFCIDRPLNSPEPIIPELKIYPNPSTGNHVTIQYPKGISAVSIFNLAGQQVAEFAVNQETQTDLTLDLNPGVYNLKILSSENKAISKRLLIK